MSFFNGLFGKTKAPPPRAPTADDTIKNMKSTQEMLKKKQAVLEAKINGEADNAKRLAAMMKTNPRKKNEAMMHLKRKKMMETHYTQLDNQILNLDQTIFAMEKAILNQSLINSQKEANRVLKQQIGQMGDAADVEDILADLDENVDEINQIGEVLAQDMSFGNDIDDDELMNELDGLAAEATHDAVTDYSAGLLGPDPGAGLQLPDLPQINPVAPMPTVPTHVPAQEEDEAAFAGLESMMNI